MNQEDKKDIFEIQSIQDFVSSVRDNLTYAEGEDTDTIHKDWVVAYRGQPAFWELKPSISRYCKGNILECEKKLLEQFKIKASQLLTTNPSTELEWMSIAQHHGLPTRLLDWTENALMSLWFAVEDDKYWDKDGLVAVYWVDKEEMLNNDSDPYTQKMTRFLLPSHITRRVTSQHGLFTVHAISKEENKIVSFDNNKKYKKYLAKYRIPAKIKKETKVVLDRLGVNSYSVFPDLDGLAKHIKWKYE